MIRCIVLALAGLSLASAQIYPVAGSDIVYSSQRRALYVSVANEPRIITIDSGGPKDFVSTPDNALSLALTTNESYLYALLRSGVVVRIDLSAKRIDQQFPVQIASAQPSIVAIPGSPNSIALVSNTVRIYDAGGVPRPDTTGSNVSGLVFADATTGYLMGNTGLQQFRVVSSGVQAVRGFAGGATGALAYAAGRLYTADGLVRDAATWRNLGRLGTQGASQMIVVPGQDRLVGIGGPLFAMWNTDAFLLVGSRLFRDDYIVRAALMDGNRFAVLTRASTQIFSFDQLEQNADCDVAVSTDDLGVTHYRVGNGLSDIAINGKVVYASVRSNACPSGNSVFAFDPTGTRSLRVGSDPTSLAISPDGNILYAGIEGSVSVARISTRDLTLLDVQSISDQPIPYPAGVRVQALNGTLFAASYADTSRNTIRIFNGKIPVGRDYTTPGYVSDFTSDGNSLYISSVNDVLRVPVDSSGLGEPSVFLAGLIQPPKSFSNGYSLSGFKLYGPDGKPVAAFTTGSPFLADLPHGRVFTYDGQRFVQYQARTWTAASSFRMIPQTGVKKVLLSDSENLIVQSDVEVLAIPLSLFTPVPDLVPERSEQRKPELKKLNLLARQAAYDPASRRLIAIVGGEAGPRGNSAVRINPSTGDVESADFVGSAPSWIAISDGGEYRYIGFDGEQIVRRFPMGDTTPDLVIPENVGYGLTVLPDKPESVLVGNTKAELVIYDRDIPRPSRQAGPFYSQVIGEDGSKLFAGPPLNVFPISDSGVERSIGSGTLLTSNFERAKGRLLGNGADGRIVDQSSLRLLGSLEFGPKYYSESEGRYYVVTGPMILVYDANTMLRIGTMQFEATYAYIQRIIPCDDGILALLDPYAGIYLLDTKALTLSLPPPPEPVQTSWGYTLEVPASDVTFNPADGYFYATVPLSSPSLANNIVRIDPTSSSIHDAIAAGSVPGAIVTGSAVFAGLDGRAAITNLTTGMSWTPPGADPLSPVFIDRMAASGSRVVASTLSRPLLNGNGWSVQRLGWTELMDIPPPAAQAAKDPKIPIPFPPPAPPPTFVALDDDGALISYRQQPEGYEILTMTQWFQRSIATRLQYPSNLEVRNGKLYTGSGLIVDLASGETASLNFGAGRPQMVAVGDRTAYYVVYEATGYPAPEDLWIVEFDLEERKVVKRTRIGSPDAPTGIAVSPETIAISSASRIYFVAR